MTEASDVSCKALLALSNDPALKGAREKVYETLSEEDLVKAVSETWRRGLSWESRKAVASVLFDLAARETPSDVPDHARGVARIPQPYGTGTLDADGGSKHAVRELRGLGARHRAGSAAAEVGVPSHRNEAHETRLANDTTTRSARKRNLEDGSEASERKRAKPSELPSRVKPEISPSFVNLSSEDEGNDNDMDAISYNLRSTSQSQNPTRNRTKTPPANHELDLVLWKPSGSDQGHWIRMNDVPPALSQQIEASIAADFTSTRDRAKKGPALLRVDGVQGLVQVRGIVTMRQIDRKAECIAMIHFQPLPSPLSLWEKGYSDSLLAHSRRNRPSSSTFSMNMFGSFMRGFGIIESAQIAQQIPVSAA
ncbi:hypothetical protein K458DRAFT_386144 [Lentithecium fluviatile CBS 122367]|uniref:Uncharacterized protein n=1 Tax=Lentithecium fluviatile CBS 122367 TaxID=1168545 RepID=A0A6G1J9S7_9PLEO|nr:hypothetical protein K458DRAFT_386144 [Lentithecium fluviatile CBS 122367]